MNKSGKTRVARFTVASVFPSSDQLAVDILRLMAAYNDIREIGNAMVSPSGPEVGVDKDVRRMGLGFQYRMFLGCLHEAFLIISSMQGSPAFKALKPSLSPDGEEALRKLNRARTDLRSQLAKGRNTAIFHYDSKEFKDALSRYTKVFRDKKEAKSRFIFKGNEAYYLLADSLRELLVFDFKTSEDISQTAEKVGKFLRQSFSWHSSMSTFLEELMIAYMKDRSIEKEFLWE